MHANKLGQKDRMFSVEGYNWISLTNTVARVRSLRKIDYYRGKGIFKKFFNCKIKQSRKKKK
jgi:ribosomal protein L6P/L9E